MKGGRSAVRWAGPPGTGSRVRRRRRGQDGCLHVRRVLLLRGRGGRRPGLRGSPFCEQRQGEAGRDSAGGDAPGTRAHSLEFGPLGAGLAPARARGAGSALAPRLAAISRGGSSPSEPACSPLPAEHGPLARGGAAMSWVELRLWEVLGLGQSPGPGWGALG